MAPGHAFNLKSGKWVRWYQLPKKTSCGPADVLSHLREGVRKRLSADAPVCCLISGGLDSSIILALAKESRREVVAFTAVFDRNSDDAKSASRLCSDLSVPLVEVPIKLSDSAVLDAVRAIEIPSKAQVEIAILCLPLTRRISSGQGSTQKRRP